MESSVLTNNGGKFTLDKIQDVASVLSIETCTTAGKDQNGLCEWVLFVTDMF